MQRCAESGETFGEGPGGSQPVRRGRLEGWLITMLLIPNKLMAGGRTPPASAGKSQWIFPHTQASMLHLISKKKMTENVGPVMVNVRYGNTICMQLCLHIEQCLKHRGHFLKYEVWIKQTGILSVLCGSVYLSLVMNSTGLIFKSKTLYTSS